MTIAVLSGPDAGKVLRTTRLRIEVGSSSGNDLVVRDPDVAPHHFTILIDANGAWRAEPTSPSTPIVIDNRWAHPDTGRRGALLYATGTELLLYPGDLEPRVLDGEIRARKTGEGVAMHDPAAKEATRVLSSRPPPPGRRVRDALPPAVDDEESAAPTLTLRETTDDRGPVPKVVAVDPLALSSMPTIGDTPMADVLAGRADLRGRGADLGDHPTELDQPPSDLLPRVLPRVMSDAGSARRSSAWDRASRGRTVVPEVLAEPESKMQAMPGASSSVVARTDDASAWGGKSNAARVVPERNAWGESAPSVRHRAPDDDPQVSADLVSPVVRADRPSGSAWNARPSLPATTTSTSGASSGTAGRSSSGGNAWNTRAAPPPGNDRPRTSAPPPESRAMVPFSGRELSIQHLGDRTQDPGLRVLREPDGELATSIRLFVTRLLDLQRTYGYRAYMLTSPEPLTGKTTVALNLAFALAEDTKRRIALIEANFRHPRMSAVLGLPPDLGLLGILEGRMGISEATAKIADRNLLVFPSGGTHPSPAEALASPRFKTLIQELASSVDIAIVDAPPVKPSADANLILPLVDAALLVVLEQGTRGTWVDQAMEQLGPERVLGAVYNRLDKKALRALVAERKERLGARR